MGRYSLIWPKQKSDAECLACEQALCLGKKIARKGKGKEGRETVDKHLRPLFPAAIPPSCNYLAEYLSVRSLSVNQFRA